MDRQDKHDAGSNPVPVTKSMTEYGILRFYPDYPVHPCLYRSHLSLHMVLERAFFAMGKAGKLHIIAESREPTLDRMLEVVFLELKISGAQHLSAAEINKMGIELHIRDKKTNIAGLQIADLLVSPMGRYVLQKKMHSDWDVITSKLYRYRGKWEGAGLVVFPKK